MFLSCCLRHIELAYPVVDIRLAGLAVLMAARYAVCPPVLYQPCPRLMEMERYIRPDTLFAYGENPLIVARPCILPRFASRAHFLDASVKVGGEVNRPYQGRYDDALVPDGQRLEDWQAAVGHLLVLHRAAYKHIVVAVAPVVGHAIHETVDALGEEIEPEVAPTLHHQPALLAPLVGIGEQEVGSETGEHHLAAPNLPRLVTPAPDGEIEAACLATFTARYLTAVHLVLTIYIAVFASGTDLGASVPRIPVLVDVCVLCHHSTLVIYSVNVQP